MAGFTGNSRSYSNNPNPVTRALRKLSKQTRTVLQASISNWLREHITSGHMIRTPNQASIQR